MSASPEQYQRIAELGQRDAKILEHLKSTMWAPAFAAQLIYGIDVPFESVEIISGGHALDGRPLHTSAPCFRAARKLLQEWLEWHEDDDEHDAERRRTVNHVEFFRFCVEEDFDTPWLRLLLKLAEIRLPGYENTLPTALDVLHSNSLPNTVHGIHPDIAPDVMTASINFKVNNIEPAGMNRLPRTTQQNIKGRRTILDTPIEVAIFKAGQDIAKDVFLELKNMALDGLPPFTGHVKDGALQYTDTNDDMPMLTFKMLSNRLARRRARLAKAR